MRRTWVVEVQGLNIVVSIFMLFQNSYVVISGLNVMGLGGGAFGRCLVIRVHLHELDQGSYKRDLTVSSSPSHHVSQCTAESDGILQLGRGPSPESDPVGTFVFIPGFQSMNNNLLLFPSHPGYHIFLQHLQFTNVISHQVKTNLLKQTLIIYADFFYLL